MNGPKMEFKVMNKEHQNPNYDFVHYSYTLYCTCSILDFECPWTYFITLFIAVIGILSWTNEHFKMLKGTVI